MSSQKTEAKAPPIKQNPMRIWIAGFLFTVALCLVLQLSHSLQIIDNSVFDLQANVLRAYNPRPVTHDVVIVGIDEASTRVFEEPLILWHQHIADFLHAAMKSDVSAIGLDIVLPSRSMNRYLPGQDEILMSTLLDAQHTVPLEIAITFDEVGAPRPVYPAFKAAAGKTGVGMSIFPRDRDQVARRFDERIATDGTEIPTFTGNLARLLNTPPGTGFIDYSIGEKFDYLPINEVLKQAQSGNFVELKRAMKDKVVLLGAIFAGVDRVPQPVSLAAWEGDKIGAGVLVQAQAIRTILNGGLLKPVSLPIIVILIIASSLFWLIPLRPIPAAVILLVLIAGLFGAALLIQINGSIFSFAAIVGSLTLSIAGRQGVENFLRLSESRRLKFAFSGYVSPGIMREIISGALTPSSDGTHAEVCVLFADIRDYTSISEHMTPKQVIAFLNRYYEGVVKAIHDEEGSIVSFMGDGIMAVFGAPNELDNACIAAVKASRGMLKYVDHLNYLREADELKPIKIGIGLNFGTAVMGHVGTSDRHDYSAIGDVTNTASRIEGLTKSAGYPIVCSRAVYEAAGCPPDFHSLAVKDIKGRSPLEVFGVNTS